MAQHSSEEAYMSLPEEPIFTLHISAEATMPYDSLCAKRDALLEAAQSIGGISMRTEIVLNTPTNEYPDPIDNAELRYRLDEDISEALNRAPDADRASGDRSGLLVYGGVRSLRDALILGKQYTMDVRNCGVRMIESVQSAIDSLEAGLEWKVQPSVQDIAILSQGLAQIPSGVLGSDGKPAPSDALSVEQVLTLGTDDLIMRLSYSTSRGGFDPDKRTTQQRRDAADKLKESAWIFAKEYRFEKVKLARSKATENEK